MPLGSLRPRRGKIRPETAVRWLVCRRKRQARNVNVGRWFLIVRDAKLFANRGRRIPDLVDGLLRLLAGHAERAGPVFTLTRSVHIDLGPVGLLGLGKFVQNLSSGRLLGPSLVL